MESSYMLQFRSKGVLTLYSDSEKSFNQTRTL